MSQVETPRPEQAPEVEDTNIETSGTSTGFMSKTRETIANLPTAVKAGIAVLGAGAIFGAGKIAGGESAPEQPSGIETVEKDFDGDGQVDERVTTETFDDPAPEEFEAPVDNVETITDQESEEIDYPEQYIKRSSEHKQWIMERIDNPDDYSRPWGFRGYVVGTTTTRGEQYWWVLENPVLVEEEDGDSYFSAPAPNGEIVSVYSGIYNDDGSFSRIKSGEDQDRLFMGNIHYYTSDVERSGQQVLFLPTELDQGTMTVRDDLEMIIRGDIETPVLLESNAKIFYSEEEVLEAVGEEVFFGETSDDRFNDYDTTE